MKRSAIVCFALVMLFLVSFFSKSISFGAADSSSVSKFSGTQSTTDWWPMFHHDLTHTGNSHSTAPNTNQTLWKFNTGGQVNSPILAGGVVYAGSYDHKVYALKASDGSLIWNYTTNGPVYSSPAVAGGIVYVGSYDHLVYAFGPSPKSRPTQGTGIPAEYVYASIAIVSIVIAIIVGYAYIKQRKNKSHSFFFVCYQKLFQRINSPC